MKRVALVTAAEARDLDEDLPPLLRALREIGVDAEAVDGGAFAAAVVRSTWGWVPKREAFLAWAERAARVTRLAHPPDLFRWNTDKRYLRELARGGAPVAETFSNLGAGSQIFGPSRPPGAKGLEGQACYPLPTHYSFPSFPPLVCLILSSPSARHTPLLG